MPIIKNAEIHYAHLDPERPNDRFDKTKPRWEVQMRTSNIEVARELRAMGINMKLISSKDPETEGEPILNANGQKEWKFSFRKNATKPEAKGGGANVPVVVVGGDMQPIDPKTIGNGTIANLDIYQYPYDNGAKVATTLMGVQVVKLVYYKPNPTFTPVPMEETVYTTGFTPQDDHDDDDQDAEESSPSPTIPPALTAGASTDAPEEDDIPF